jgi:4-hydroxy-tetrahydrodipicolinate reductase
MKIAIIGYGKMGKMIEQQAKEESITISRIIDTKYELVSAYFNKDEVAIEFTEPDVCLGNIEILTNKGVNIICGTTGWYEHMEKVKRLVSVCGTGFLYASNFSIGVNIFWKIVKEAATIIDKFEDYDVLVHEIHHGKKKDSPSGTAITTAHIILDNIKRKEHIVTEKMDKAPKANEVHVSSTRGGHVIGKHEVMFDSLSDSISILHDSKGRSAYAKGAINCAKWVQSKRGFFNINDYMNAVVK